MKFPCRSLVDPRIRRLVGFLVLTTGLLAVPIVSANPPSPSKPSEKSPPKPEFFAPSATIWLNETQVVPIRLSSAPDKKTTLPTRLSPSDAGEVLLPATILPGETTGFLRVRGLREGKANLEVAGRKLPIEIRKNLASPVLAPRPQIISPPEGACLYGDIAVGVEVNLADPAFSLSPPRLVLPNGPELTPRAQTLTAEGSARIYLYDLKADSLPRGPLTLRTHATDSLGNKVEGEPVEVRIIRPEPKTIISGACADRIHDKRPERWEGEIPAVSEKNSDQSQHVVNASSNPSWCLAETIKEPGHYQLTMRVRGDPAMGSFPSLGILLNEEDKPVAASRLIDTRWHRIPVGPPVALKAGKQILTVRFLNDFSRGKGNDRNAFLDRYELVRVSSGEPASGTAPAMTMMMMEDEAGPMTGDSSFAEKIGLSFDERLNDRVVQGPLVLSATCQQTPKSSPPAAVELVVNGETAATQYGKKLIFALPTGALRPGKNTLQLRARSASGSINLSPAETVYLPKDAPSSEASRSLRFTVEDPAWNPDISSRLTKDGQTAEFLTNGEAVLRLPESLTGKFALRMEARGQEFKGPPIIEAFLKTGSEPAQKIGEAGVYSNRTFTLGDLQLPAGQKQIILKFGNDLYDAKKKGDRNWWLRAALLEETPTAGEKHSPTVRLLYPKDPSLTVTEADAVVAQVFAPDGLEWTDLLIDGKPQNQRISDPSGLGRVVLPFTVAGLSPGKHQLEVRTRSRNGIETTSSPVALQVRDQPTSSRYLRAVHLLNRFGYGPEQQELADLLILGETAWLQDRLTQPWNAPAEAAAFQSAWNAFPDRQNNGQVVQRALYHLLRSPNPVRNRLVLWTENHFSTWLQKTKPVNKWDEHVRFLELGPAPFSTLLKASATSPAMLVYLDQYRSFAKRLNENYAREVMELHTVGVHAGYRQEDVTALAGLLTGWALTDDAPTVGSPRDLQRTFRYDPVLNTSAAQRIFGMEFPETKELAKRQDRALSALEMLAARPETARFISRKLAEHYVSLPAPDSLVDHLSKRFLANGGDLADLVITIAKSPEFWDTIDRPKIATPLDFSLRLSRIAGYTNAGAVNGFLRQSGTGLFDRATPDGYPEGDADYADSNALLRRWRFTSSIANNLRRVLPETLVPETSETTPDKALDHVALRLTGRPLPPTSRKAATEYLSTTPFDKKDDARRVLTSLVAQLPPSSLR